MIFVHAKIRAFIASYNLMCIDRLDNQIFTQMYIIVVLQSQTKAKLGLWFDFVVYLPEEK